MANRIIYGVGTNNVPYGTGYLAKTKEGITREYDHWCRMLQRSYDPKWFEKHPTYEKCEVKEVWWDYQAFASYYHNCEYKPINSDLDKDLLVFRNKVYGPDTCVFLPEQVNKGIVIRGRVSVWHSRDEKYETYCNGVYIGRSYDPLHYADTWLKNKQTHIQSLAENYKNILDPRAYDALMNFTVGVIDEKGTVARLS